MEVDFRMFDGLPLTWLEKIWLFVPIFGRLFPPKKYEILFNEIKFSRLRRSTILFENTILYFLVGFFLSPFSSCLEMTFNLVIVGVTIAPLEYLAYVRFDKFCRACSNLRFRNNHPRLFRFNFFQTVYHALWFLYAGFILGRLLL